jgi:ion channel
MTPSSDPIAVVLPLSVAVTMTFSTVIIQALALMPIIYFVRYELRRGRAGVRFWKDVGIIAGATLVALAAHVVAIASWALVFSFCGEFSQLAGAVYHSAMNYTTLGDSDKVMSPLWRVLAPLEAANGMLMFGVSTALLYAVIQRLIQTRLSESSNYNSRVQSAREGTSQRLTDDYDYINKEKP